MARFASEIQAELAEVYDKIKNTEINLGIADATLARQMAEFKQLSIAIEGYRDNFKTYAGSEIVALKVFRDARERIERFDNEAASLQREINSRLATNNRAREQLDQLKIKYSNLQIEIQTAGADLIEFKNPARD